jgi:hypothetical protein
MHLKTEHNMLLLHKCSSKCTSTLLQPAGRQGTPNGVMHVKAELAAADTAVKEVYLQLWLLLFRQQQLLQTMQWSG